jgi:xanthine/CO dehydrogenase XdhC/CoxF family maturation factor
MRRALDCESADPLTHEAHRNRLFAAQQGFHGRGKTPDNIAASIAAQAVQFALLGYPAAMVEQVGAKAEEAHELAQQREPRR